MPRGRCTYEACLHDSRRERLACRAELRHARMVELDTKERLIREERIALMLDAERERDLPMPGEEPGSDHCPACQRLLTG